MAVRALQSHPAIRLLLLCVINTVVPVSATGQSIQGRVTEENTQRPLSSVTVTLLDRELIRVADTKTTEPGNYEFHGLQPGTYWLRFQLPGFQASNVGPIVMAEGKAVEKSVELRRLQPVTLDTVVIEGQRVPRYLEDFYRRKSQKAGGFLTQKDIERYWPARVTDLVPRLGGFELVHGGDGEVYVRTRRPAGFSRARCAPLLFVDGALRGTTDSQNLDDFLWVDNVAAIEAYDGPSKMPPEFNVTGSACGVIVVWTKR